jgi:hypothetical protein
MLEELVLHVISFDGLLDPRLLKEVGDLDKSELSLPTLSLCPLCPLWLIS